MPLCSGFWHVCASCLLRVETAKPVFAPLGIAMPENERDACFEYYIDYCLCQSLRTAAKKVVHIRRV